MSAARNFGFVFTERSSRTITIQALGTQETHELLCILDFNNVRKRMSVIVKHEGRIRLYSKGADNVIFERLAANQEEKKARTQEHLDKFATEGLRTLVLGVRELSQEQFDDWKADHHQAAIAIDNREEKLDAVYNTIERDLTLIGATAIEDKLQDGVPQTIANLQLAGIKVWVLTGDKQETAINIGYSCNLLNDDMWDEPYIVDGHTSEEVMKQLIAHRRSIDRHLGSGGGGEKVRDDLSMRTLSVASTGADSLAEVSGGFALVINGHSLVHALTPDMELAFLGVAEHCTAVICCRVTPLQKALVVELIKKYKEAVCLAIGDGANDVSMIKAADIGVGISGQEGMQAVLASDYSIAQFRSVQLLTRQLQSSICLTFVQFRMSLWIHAAIRVNALITDNVYNLQVPGAASAGARPVVVLQNVQVSEVSSNQGFMTTVLVFTATFIAGTSSTRTSHSRCATSGMLSSAGFQRR